MVAWQMLPMRSSNFTFQSGSILIEFESEDSWVDLAFTFQSGSILIRESITE